MKLFAALAMTALATQAFASGLIAPIALDSAQVMPKGVRSMRLAGFTFQADDKYSGNGTVVSLANDINRPITLRQLADAQPKGFERGQFKGGLESLGLDLDSVVGSTNGSVDTRITTTLPILVWGVTQKFTVAVAVPIIYSNMNVATGWTANGMMQKVLDTAVAKGLGSKVIAKESSLQNVVQTKLDMLGYKPLVSETHTDLGDVNLVAKYQILKGDQYAVALAPRVVLPTGRVADSDKVIDIAGGDGQWDVGLGLASDYFITSKLSLTASTGYTYQISSLKRKRIPNSWDESLSSDVDDSTLEKYGNIFSTGLGVRWQVHPVITLGVGYSYQSKEGDTYSGGKYEQSRYDILAKDSVQTLQAAQAVISLSTVDLFLKKKFVAPLEVNLGFTGILAAQNVPLANLTSLELVSYF
jgi:hypothetical protein